MNTQDKIQIMQAFVEGKTIETKHKTIPGDQYLPLAREKEPVWNWGAFDYRIKPEPMEIKLWCGPDGTPACLNSNWYTTDRPDIRYTLKTFVEKA